MVKEAATKSSLDAVGSSAGPQLFGQVSISSNPTNEFEQSVRNITSWEI